MSVLGISFIGNVISLFAANEKKEIELMSSINALIDFDKDIPEYKNDNFLILEIAEKIQDEVNKHVDKIDKAGILFGSNQAFMNIIPAEADESPEGISSLLQWELSIYFPDNYKDYIVNYYKLGNPALPQNVNELLMVAFSREKIDFIRKIFTLLDMKIGIVDVDHFSAEKCLRENHGPELKKSTIVLAGFKKNRVDVSLLVNGELMNYQFITCEDSDCIEKLDEYLQQLKIITKTGVIDNVYVYGNIPAVLSGKNMVGYSLINPFNKFSANYTTKNDPALFIPLMGIVLKNFTNAV